MGYVVCYLCVLYLRLLCVVVDVVFVGLWLRSGFTCLWLCVVYCGGFYLFICVGCMVVMVAVGGVICCVNRLLCFQGLVC